MSVSVSFGKGKCKLANGSTTLDNNSNALEIIYLLYEFQIWCENNLIGGNVPRIKVWFRKYLNIYNKLETMAEKWLEGEARGMRRGKGRGGVEGGKDKGRDAESEVYKINGRED